MEKKRILLENIPKVSGQILNDDYFQNMSDQILARVAENKPNQRFVFSKYYWVAAACLVLLMVGFWMQNAQNQQFSEVNNTQIVAYLETQTFNDKDLAELFVDQKSLENELKDIKAAHLSNDELLEIMELEGDI